MKNNKNKQTIKEPFTEKFYPQWIVDKLKAEVKFYKSRYEKLKASK